MQMSVSFTPRMLYPWYPLNMVLCEPWGQSERSGEEKFFLLLEMEFSVLGSPARSLSRAD